MPELSDKSSISAFELVTILLMARLVEPATFFSMVDYYEGTSSWLSPMVTFVLAIILLKFYLILVNKFGKNNFFDFTELYFGKTISVIIGFIFIYYFFQITATTLRETGEVILTFFLTDTPLYAVIVPMIFLAMQASTHGLEIIGRASLVIMPVFFAGLLVIILTASPDFNILNLVPFLEGGIKPVVISGFYLLSRLQTFLILLMLVPFVRNREKIFPYFTLGITDDMLIMMTGVIFVYGIFGIFQGNSLIFEFLEVARTVGPQIDVIAVAAWVAISFIKISIFYYCFNLAFCQLFKLKSYKMLLIPSAIIFLNMSYIIFSNQRQRAEYVTGADFPYSLAVIFLPLLILLFSFLLKSKNAKVE